MGFLRDHKASYLSDFDYRLFAEESDSLDIFTDAVLEEFDILNNAVDKFPDLVSINDIPDDLINHLSAVVGWRQTDYAFNFLTFRDVVRNIVRIYKIKGTKLSYDVFFRAFGYVPQVYDLWWDRNGNLTRTKPRGAPNSSLPTNRLNKSNFVEIQIDLVLDDPAIPNPFSNGEFLRIIFEYLLFLKPVHIRYKPIIVNVPAFNETPVTVETSIPIIIVGDQKTPLGVGVDGLFEEHLPNNHVPDDNMQIFAFRNQVDQAPMRYNNTIRYGTSIARIIKINNVTFPVSIIQRESAHFGDKASPIPDKLDIVVQAKHFIGEERLQIRYNNYIRYDDQTEYSPDRVFELRDGVDFDSTDFSFGPGDIWTEP